MIIENNIIWIDKGNFNIKGKLLIFRASNAERKDFNIYVEHGTYLYFSFEPTSWMFDLHFVNWSQFKHQNGNLIYNSMINKL